MYIPTNLHTHYSLLRSFIKTDKLAAKLADYDIGACCLTDFDVLSGSVSFFLECQKKGIKPILGTKIFVKCSDMSGYVTLLAQNPKGWQELISISSLSYLPSHYIERPSISLEELFRIKNCLVLVGTQESILFNAIYGTPSYTNPIIHSSTDTSVKKLIEVLKSEFDDRLIFQLEKSIDSLASNLAADLLSSKAKQFNIMTVATPSPFYLNEDDKDDQILLTATKFGCDIGELNSKVCELENSIYSQMLTKNLSLQSPIDFEKYYSESEIKNSNLISDMCDNYTILRNPNLPKFNTPDGYDEDSYLKQLCREGWNKKIANKIDEFRKSEYVNRVLYELDVIKNAKLSGYFLIVQEYVNWVKNQGWLVGPGRGSAAGCFVSYLTNITTLDPVEHGLLFERFYNDGRNTKDNISLPDIDIDFVPEHRKHINQHIINTYGHDKVGQVVTFSRLSGRGALKEVLRATNACENSEMDKITSRIPQESEIADRMEVEHETSVLNWTINNEPKSIEDYVYLDDNGVLQGQYASAFTQGMRIEGTYKSYGKHASALVISGTPLSDTIPMIKEKSSNELILGIEYEFAEKMGAAKLDILGLNTLKKLMDVNKLLRYGRIIDE